MFTTKVSADSKADLLTKSKTQREARERDKRCAGSALVIQRHWRRHLSNVSLRTDIMTEVERTLSRTDYTAIELYHVISKVMFLGRRKHMTSSHSPSSDVLCRICDAILGSNNVPDSEKSRWYLSLAISKHSKDWLRQVMLLLSACLEDLGLPDRTEEGSGNSKGGGRKIDLSRIDHKHKVRTYLLFFRLACDVGTWRIYQVSTANTLVIQVLERFSDTLYTHLVSRGLLSAIKAILMANLRRVEPSLHQGHLDTISGILHLVFNRSAYDTDIWLAMFLSVFATPSILSRLNTAHVRDITLDVHVVTAMTSLTTHTPQIISVLEKDEVLFLLLNVLHLLFEALRSDQRITYPAIVDTIHVLLRAAANTTGKAAHWHPILGLCEGAVSVELTNSVKQLTIQISMLYSRMVIKFFFQDLLETEFPKEKLSSWKALFAAKLHSESKLLRHVSKICSLYLAAIATFEKFKTDILMSLCCLPDFLFSLWQLVYTEHYQSSRALARAMTSRDEPLDPFVPVLVLFCSCFSQYFVVLSDEEIYEREQPFSLRELVTIADFVNGMIFNVIWNNHVGLSDHVVMGRVNICHGLLILLHERDQRRSFTPNSKFWTPRDASPGSILTELRAAEGSPGRAQKVADFIPWIFPQKRKMEYLHSIIKQDKANSRGDHQKTFLVKINRKRLFEDGFESLKNLSNEVLKHQLKILFINELGLEEAGIDQDGVMKEFLEETITYGLNPSFGLFSVTDENHCHYPSPLSRIHAEYTELFHYLGRIIGKAVYEGVTLDATFAPFFIRQVLHNKNALFSYLDELPGLDAELYRNLIFIKTYDGNVEDLGLTFSIDENEFGRMITYELIPGGSVTAVTNSNRISYIHQMAHYKMYTQIQSQTRAFVAGFKSVINDSWLRMFSLPEIQKLVSGDVSAIDLMELKKHVRYLGGYHGNHRVITWFWDICINDFNEKEKSLLLKFVTSCSKPPLLGFGSMSPPFSIRAVDEDDAGNDDHLTPGQVLRTSFKSFLGIQSGSGSGSSRLPTASTCFNLLKLPLYSKKAILREKLRYAINASAGFELS